MTGTVRKYDVFFSYNWRDCAAVEAVARTLRKQGLTVFLDRWYLVPGRPWPEALEEALKNCQAVLVFLGPHGMGGWQQREKDLALNRQTRDSAFPVIPVLLPGADPALGFLSLNTWVDMQAGIDDPLAIAVLAAAAHGQPPGPELQEQMNATLATICPYRGLRAFREEDAPLFFGREVFTARLAEAVSQHTMIAVVGASGCGKSSVVRAGLVPYLRKGVAEQVWDIATLVPGDRPLHALAAALVPVLEPEMTETDRLAEIGKLAGHFAEKSVALRDVVARILEKQAGTGRLLLVVDQWEELYTLVHNDQIRQRFLDGLLEATAGGMLTVVLTLRGDFFGRVLSHRALADRLQNAIVNLGPMTREELEHAIEAPAKKVGLTFEPGLVGRILDDVEQEPGSLPLLEFVLTGLWERRHASTLLHEAYEEMGEVRGAMARRADEVFGKLSPVDQELVRRVLVQLVRPGEGTEDTRRRATFTEVGEAARPAVQQLTDARLTVTARNEATGEETVEVAHEALIQNWARLRGWLDEDREFLLWRQRLRAHMHEWEHSEPDKKKDAVLRGALLIEAECWLVERADDISPSEQDFVKHSVAWREHEQIARERLRNRIATGLVAGLLMALALAVLASLQWYRAEQAKAEAESQAKAADVRRLEADRLRGIAFTSQLGAQAQLTIEQKANLLQRGLLLAVEAMGRSHSLEADQALRRGLVLLPRLVTKLVHDKAVQVVAFSPDGKYLATASDDNTARVWDAATGEQIACMSHEGPVSSLAFSPDGKYVTTASEDKTARIWEATTGEEIARMSHEEPVSFVAFSPDGKYVATASDANTARVWEATTGEEIARMSHDGRVSSIAFSPDGKYLATASDANTAWVWETTTGEQIARMSHEGPASSLAFSPDGKYLATASSDHTARVWEVPTGKELASMNHQNFAGEVRCVAFSPDGKYLATASRDRTARVWEANSGQELIRMNHGGEVRSVVYSPDGKYLATASWDNTTRVWEVASRRELTRIDHEGVLSIAFSPDGKYLATASKDKTARVWESTSRTEIHVSNDGMVGCVAFSPDGKYFATASSGETTSAQVWEATNGIRIAHKKHDEVTHAVAFSPDGKYLATASLDNTVRVWEDVNSVSEVNSMNLSMNHDEAVRSVAFSPSGKYLATGSEDKTARVWDATTGEQIARMSHSGWVYSVAFSPDGKYLATGSRDKTARVWDATTGEKIARIIHENHVFSVAFSPDGKYLATACMDASARIWQVPPDKELALGWEEMARVNHDEHVSSVAFSPDGKYLATASVDRTARIWELSSGKEVARISHENWVLTVAFSPDGRYLATGGADGTARVSFVQREELMAEARSRLIRNLTYEEWQLYIPDEPYRKTCPNLPVHPSLIEAGRDLARKGDVNGAIAIFRRAVELEPTLDLDPEEEAQHLAPPSDD